MAQMITINLLDWRQERRELRQKRFFMTLGAAALINAGLVFAAMSVYDAAISHQQSRNNFLRSEITKIDRQIKEIQELERTRENLITRMRIIEELQRSRAEVVRYFDQLVETLPEGVYLTSVKQQGDKTTINGIAESNGRISDYMVNLDDSPWFTNPRLIVIKSQPRGSRRFAEFTLTFKSASPKTEDREKEASASAVTAGGRPLS